MKKRWSCAAALLLALPACDGAGSAYDAGGRTGGVDAGSMTFEDGSVPPPASDAGGDAGGGAADAGPVAPGESEYDSALGAADARAACFDGEDNDEDGAFDCGDGSCQRNVPSCCVGRSSVDCCPAGVEERLHATGCDGLLADCASGGLGFVTFGSPAPTARDFGDGVPAIVPGGAETDSGAVLSRDLDPRGGTLRLTASIATPLDDPASGRVETMGVGFVDAAIDPLAGPSRVAPIAGLVVSRNRSEVLLVVAGEVVQRWPLELGTAVTYTLELDPTGRVRASSSPSFVSADLRFAVAPPAVRAVAYGRTANPAASTPPARLLDLTVTPSDCDMPAALARSDAPSVPAPGADTTWADAHVRIGEPSVVRYVDAGGVTQIRMALMVDGELHLAAPGAGGFELLSRIGEPALPTPPELWAAGGVSDPSLVHRADQLELYFTAWSAAGRGTIARATWDEGTERFVVEGPVPGLQGTADEGYSAASVFDLGGTLHVALRVDDLSGHHLAIYRLGAGAEPVTTALRAPDQGDVFAFDRDEVDGPAYVFHGGVHRLYFAGRRGTRWSLGLLVSDDGYAWHAPSEDPIFGPRGAGFDALGVRDPALDVVDGRVELYYGGDDGERIRVGLAR